MYLLYLSLCDSSFERLFIYWIPIFFKYSNVIVEEVVFLKWASEISNLSKVKGCVIWSCLPLSPPGSVLLQQTDGGGRTALDLVSTASQKDELLQSAQVGDTALRNKVTKILNFPLLEAGSSLLAHLIPSYQCERGLRCQIQSSDKAHGLDYRLVRALETHSFQKVTLGWTDQRVMRFVEDAQTLLEFGRGRYLGQLSQGVKYCKGENTVFLMEILENLKSQGESLVVEKLCWICFQLHVLMATLIFLYRL